MSKSVAMSETVDFRPDQDHLPDRMRMAIIKMLKARVDPRTMVFLKQEVGGNVYRCVIGGARDTMPEGIRYAAFVSACINLKPQADHLAEQTANALNTLYGLGADPRLIKTIEFDIDGLSELALIIGFAAIENVAAVEAN